MNRKVLFIDFDETLFSTRNAFNLFLKEHYGVTIPDEQHTCGSRMEDLVLKQLPPERRPTLDEFYLYISEHFLSSIERHQNVIPLEGSVQAINILAEHFRLFIVTARQKTSRPVVEALSEKFFPDKFEGFHFVWEHSGDMSFKDIPKREFIGSFPEKLRAGFIDDSPKEIEQVINLAPCLLFDDRGFHTMSTHARVTHWKQVLEYFL